MHTKPLIDRFDLRSVNRSGSVNGSVLTPSGIVNFLILSVVVRVLDCVEQSER